MAWDGPLRPGGDGVVEIPTSYKGREGDLEMRVPGRIIADDTLLPHLRDDLAPEQVANVATMPGIVGASWAMPDIHLGYGFPIGGVAAFAEDGVVSPGGVGFDINCGVRLLTTDLEEADVRARQHDLLDALYRSVPAGMGGRGKAGIEGHALDAILTDGAVWAVEQGLVAADERRRIEEHGRIDGALPEHVSERAKERGRRTIGSLGSGNHFAEVQVVDETWEPAFGLREGQVVLMIHTGSRGLGHQVAQDHLDALQTPRFRLPDRQLACAPLGSREADAYLGAMAAAANFAFVNRSLLAHQARQAFASVFGRDAGPMEALYDVCHNIAKWEDHPVADAPDAAALAGVAAQDTPRKAPTRRVLVHRKGATRAFGPGHPELPQAYRDVGQPVIVPGDMGRQSFVLVGTGGGARAAAGDGAFASCCHGAGRLLSRSQAKRTWRGQDLVAELGQQGITVRAVSPAVAAEEAPGAYKDVADVVGAVEAAGLARRAARLRPIGVVKG